MTDKTDDPGKGHPRPSDGPRRPYATLDLKATEVGRGGSQAAPPGGAPGGAKPDPAMAALPPPPSDAGGWQQWKGGAWVAALAGGLAAAVAWAFRLVRSKAFLSHAAAGVAGAALTLAVAALLGLLPARQAGLPPDVVRRLAAVEEAQARQPGLPAAVADKLAAADKRLSGLEEGQAKAIAALKAEQAALATEAKALQERVSAPETAERIAKLEAALEKALAALPADGATGTPAALAARLADVEKLSGEAGAAKAAAARLERDLAALTTGVDGLRQSLEALKASVKASVEEAIPAKLAGVERDLQAVKKTEGERAAGTQRVLLALEIANLKRALDRGDSYARELAAARKAAAGAIDLAALDRLSATGVPTLGILAQDFKRVAGAALDAEAEQPDASVLDRLMAGARSVVRLRKTHHTADDVGVEATLARMEAALKDGNIGEVLAQSKRLPPKAAAAAAGWLSRLEARYAADKAVAEIEAALKSALAGGDMSAPEPKR